MCIYILSLLCIFWFWWLPEYVATFSRWASPAKQTGKNKQFPRGSMFLRWRSCARLCSHAPHSCSLFHPISGPCFLTGTWLPWESWHPCSPDLWPDRLCIFAVTIPSLFLFGLFHWCFPSPWCRLLKHPNIFPTHSNWLLPGQLRLISLNWRKTVRIYAYRISRVVEQERETISSNN